eukprot:XP_020398542.1 vegetative cell wall protein gp1-like [Zea mays]
MTRMCPPRHPPSPASVAVARPVALARLGARRGVPCLGSELAWPLPRLGARAAPYPGRRGPLTDEDGPGAALPFPLVPRPAQPQRARPARVRGVARPQAWHARDPYAAWSAPGVPARPRRARGSLRGFLAAACATRGQLDRDVRAIAACEADENSGPTSSSPAFSGSFQTVLTTPRRRTPPPPTTLPHSSAQGPAPLTAQGPAPPGPHDAAAQPGPHDAARQRRRAPSPTPPKVPRRSAPTTPPRSPAPTTPPASSRATRRRAELLRPHDAACTPPLQPRPSPPAPARRAPRPCTLAEPHARPAEPHVAARGPRALARPRRREPAVREGSPWPPSRRREPAVRPRRARRSSTPFVHAALVHRGEPPRI